MAETTLNVAFVTETCCHKGCGLTFAFTRDFYNQVRNDPARWWFCPEGHTQHYTGQSSDAQKLRDAEARETAVRDQLESAVRDAEQARSLRARDLGRIAKGVCPCCNRYFANVHRHMTSQHPEFPAPDVSAIKFECSCGSRFDTYHGLRIHQGLRRDDDWARTKYAYRQHLTVGATR